MRTVLLGLLGLALAVTVGLGVHLLTRSTISLPVVQARACSRARAARGDDEGDDDRAHRDGERSHEPRTRAAAAHGSGHGDG